MKVNQVSIEMRDFTQVTRRISGYPGSFSKNNINRIEGLFSRIKEIVNRNVSNSLDFEDDYFDLIDDLKLKITTEYTVFLEEKIFFEKAKGVVDEKIFYQTDRKIHAMLLPLAHNYVNAVKDLSQALKEDLWSFANLKDKITDIAKKHQIFTEQYSSAYVLYRNCKV